MGIVFFIRWIILNGRVTTELVLLGFGIAAVVFVFARSAFGYSLRTEVLVWRHLPWTVVYFLNLILEILKASVQVGAIILNPKRHPDPVLVEFDTQFHTMIQNVILANSITLTPGTYTVEQSGNHFRIHCLVPSFGEGLESSSFVKLLDRMHIGSEG